MGQLTQDEFFVKLTELFTHGKGKDHGAIYLVQKRYVHGQPAVASDEEEVDLPVGPILIRASNGKAGEKRAERVKLSTLVDPTELDAFYGRYAEACKAGMGALKPRDRTKRKAKAKKKKGGA